MERTPKKRAGTRELRQERNAEHPQGPVAGEVLLAKKAGLEKSRRIANRLFPDSCKGEERELAVGIQLTIAYTRWTANGEPPWNRTVALPLDISCCTGVSHKLLGFVAKNQKTAPF